MKNLYVGIQLFVEAYPEHKELLDKFIKKENGTIGITNNNLSFILNALKKQGITTESELGGKINAKYDAEQQESIIDEKTLEGFSSEEDLAKAFGVKPLEQSKNLEELSKEDLWKELVDLGYDSYESLEEYESFIKDFGIKGTIEETLIQTIKNNKTGEKDSFIDLSLNKILKDNNITKNC